MQNGSILKAEGIYKSFGQTKALCGIDVNVKPGEIHGLIGENGSGKSTFSSIVAGTQSADAGTMTLAGKPFAPASLIESVAAGVSMLMQEQTTIGGTTVAANLFIGKEDPFIHTGIINVKEMYRKAREVLGSLGVTHISPDIMINKLSFEDRKLIEIARAMYSDPKLLIVDETTTALTINGRNILYNLMRKMRDEGKSILFISHDIDEIMEFSDSLTILRDGHMTATLTKDEFDENRIKQLMVGREIAENFYRTDYDTTYGEEAVIQCDHISSGILKDVSLTLHKGEILGIGGLTDCGMHEIGKILFGLVKPDVGTVRTLDCPNVNSAITAIRHGIGYVSKSRDKEALMPVASIRDNVCLPSLKELSRHGYIGKKKEAKFVKKWTDELQIKMDSIDQSCSHLSGGNKQKVVLSKWLGKDSEILILDCPTRGIDIGVKSLIYKLMVELKQRGKSILMISEELPELIGMSDRIVILKDGALSGEFQREKKLTESELIQYMI